MKNSLFVVVVVAFEVDLFLSPLHAILYNLNMRIEEKRNTNQKL